MIIDQLSISNSGSNYGLFSVYDGSYKVQNSLVIDSYIQDEGQENEYYNSTLINNNGGFYNGDPTIYNCILYGNNLELAFNLWDDESSVNWSLLWNNIFSSEIWGTEIIESDPLFCNPDSGDYSLAENSPCVGAGENGVNMGAFGIGCETILSTDKDVIPLQYVLHQNHPNPFNPVTTLRYDLPENSLVNITIYDMLGRQVKTLVNQTQDAGYRSVIWNATNDYGKPVSAGIYLYQIQAGEFVQTKKMVLLK